MMLSYIQRDTYIHSLTGATKLLFFLMWSVAAMLTYDTRILVVLLIGGLFVFWQARLPYRSYSVVLYLILFFLLLNNVAIFIFAPSQGTEIYGTSTELFHLFGPYSITSEQLFYQFNLTLKYFTIIPMGLLFILATQPSEFAASLNRIGVSYKIAYSVAIALRYIPDVQREYQDISFAQQARGMDMSKKEKLTKRIRYAFSILMPLVFSSLERIETISSAMELRGFGTGEKRTWYHGKEFQKGDYITLVVGVVILVTSLVVTFYDGSRFYNPFV